MQVVDKGHTYELPNLDGSGCQTLRFVKRMGKGYPGNHSAQPGVNCQSVIRALLDRMRYLQDQIWSLENAVSILCLRITLWLFEFRAARRHGFSYFHGLIYAEYAPMCKVCGHTDCDHKREGAQ